VIWHVELSMELLLQQRDLLTHGETILMGSVDLTKLKVNIFTLHSYKEH